MKKGSDDEGTKGSGEEGEVMMKGSGDEGKW